MHQKEAQSHEERPKWASRPAGGDSGQEVRPVLSVLIHLWGNFGAFSELGQNQSRTREEENLLPKL